MYLTYEEYASYGGTLEESAFNSLGYDIQKSIDYYTFDRLKNDTELSEAVKRTFFELMRLKERFEDYITRVSDMDNPIMNGASNDGVSGTFGGYMGSTSPSDINTLSDKLKKDMYELIRRYLSGERNQSGQILLYRGVYR